MSGKTNSKQTLYIEKKIYLLQYFDLFNFKM